MVHVCPSPRDTPEDEVWSDKSDAHELALRGDFPAADTRTLRNVTDQDDTSESQLIAR